VEGDRCRRDLPVQPVGAAGADGSGLLTIRFCRDPSLPAGPWPAGAGLFLACVGVCVDGQPFVIPHAAMCRDGEKTLFAQFSGQSHATATGKRHRDLCNGDFGGWIGLVAALRWTIEK
jgi:hypothetical protein